MNGPLLSADVTGFTFHGDDAPALRRLRFSVARGTLTAVLGGSGSGKSTLGRLLGGWLRPGDAGTPARPPALGGSSLEFRGGPDDPRIDPAAWSQRVAYVPQDAASMLSTVRATVAEELAFGLENRGTPRPEMLREVSRTAELLGLAAAVGPRPGNAFRRRTAPAGPGLRPHHGSRRPDPGRAARVAGRRRRGAAPDADPRADRRR